MPEHPFGTQRGLYASLYTATNPGSVQKVESFSCPSLLNWPPPRELTKMKTGRVKFFSSQKGYGFIIPDKPIDGHAEVFVHHTVIHNRGGFKSLCENELVEFEVVRGPKGLQATRVTGPDGAYVRGDPYSRLRTRMFATTSAGELGSSPAAGPFFPYTQFSLPANYSQVLPYGHVPQPQFAPFAFSGSPPPQPQPGSAIAATTGDGGFALPAAHHARDSAHPRYYGIVMPVPQKHHASSALPDAYASFVRPPAYDAPAFAPPVSASLHHSSPAPSFSAGSRQNTGSSQITAPQYTHLSD
ncbi:hypothetical protein IWW55_000728 [Coemansia sp. RSA 2706]|nr:hypothetical protein LPJ63_002459 [Coemansia sp. RSA 2711]KAJ2307904.1 hypothetical protein IWW55_000728 [Coemansia sp. RSA 2706]KAJ2312143.1 hypothetical protein IWW54_002260 [Coemansia sp. RSA 2705]KAJ2321553.1 hypothetical protein IWW52_000678 [Coemansia sp. RSA 2704]KAJ2329270.1 hypothetical protein IWW51_000704 [Coemansia sp. RSA 2702]